MTDGYQHSEINAHSRQPVAYQPFPNNIVTHPAVSIIQKKSREEEKLQSNPAHPLNNNALDDISERNNSAIYPEINRTGMPDHLQAGIEKLSDFSMNDVKVYDNFGKPAQLHALAYAQGTDIHIAPGQERHLPHEAWHVVQQKQGRVRPTMQMKGGVNINDDKGLEKEADVMGEDVTKMIQRKGSTVLQRFIQKYSLPARQDVANPIVQKIRNINEEQTLTDFKNNPDRGDSATDQPLLVDVKKNYEKSLDSGKRLFNKEIEWFTNAPKKEPPISTYGGTYQSVINAGYKVFWFFPGKDSVTICMIRGEEYNELDSGEVSGYQFADFEDDQDFMYANTFNVKTGEFHASINYRNWDSEVAKEEGLPPALSNSEIIWFQQEHAKDVFRDKYPSSGKLSPITSISREQIGNTQTLDTIFICDEERIAYKGGRVILYEPKEESLALLGTPNGNSSVWMLIQHAESGKVDIKSIEYTQNGLVINYLFL